MATIADNLSRIQQAKSDIRTSIQNKGVQVPETDTIDTYSGYIDQIVTGGTSGEVTGGTEDTVVEFSSEWLKIQLTEPDEKYWTSNDETFAYTNSKCYTFDNGGYPLFYYDTNEASYKEMTNVNGQAMKRFEVPSLLRLPDVGDVGQLCNIQYNGCYSEVYYIDGESEYIEGIVTSTNNLGGINNLYDNMYYTIYQGCDESGYYRTHGQTPYSNSSYKFLAGNFHVSNCFSSEVVDNTVYYRRNSQLSNYNSFHDVKCFNVYDDSNNFYNIVFDLYDGDYQYNIFPKANVEKYDWCEIRTNNLTSFYQLFGGCYKLKSIDLSGFNTSNVTDMTRMFGDCTSLTELDLSGFNTSNVTNMNYMFGNCTSLTELDLSGFDMSNVTNTNDMFQSSTGLTSVVLPSTIAVIGERCFTSCWNLTSITCHATTAPTVQSTSFNGVKSGGTLYVPSGSDYSSWLELLNNWTIVEMN